MTESSAIGLTVVNGGARSLRKRDDALARLLLDGSSAIVLTSFRTTVLISVFLFVYLFVSAFFLLS
jgi:hypothetical protein